MSNVHKDIEVYETYETSMSLCTLLIGISLHLIKVSSALYRATSTFALVVHIFRDMLNLN